METTLHRELKQYYADAEPGARCEVRLGRYIIDVVAGDELIEIQHSALGAFRDKIADLLEQGHRVLVVKPLVASKTIVKLDAKGGREIDRRRSPKRATVLTLFEELVYFHRVFPHPNLALETILVDVEERRFPGHGRRRRKKTRDFIVEDRRLIGIGAVKRFTRAADLRKLIACDLPDPFTAKDLAAGMRVRAGIARRIAYVLRNTGAAYDAGKRGNAKLYTFRRPDHESQSALATAPLTAPPIVIAA